MTKGSFLQKVINALKQTSDEFINDKIRNKLNQNEQILARDPRTQAVGEFKNFENPNQSPTDYETNR